MSHPLASPTHAFPVDEPAACGVALRVPRLASLFQRHLDRPRFRLVALPPPILPALDPTAGRPIRCHAFPS